MTEKEKAFKISLLTKILREEYGIGNRAQFMEAYSMMQPIDISIFVTPVSPNFTKGPNS